MGENMCPISLFHSILSPVGKQTPQFFVRRRPFKGRWSGVLRLYQLHLWLVGTILSSYSCYMRGLCCKCWSCRDSDIIGFGSIVGGSGIIWGSGVIGGGNNIVSYCATFVYASECGDIVVYPCTMVSCTITGGDAIVILSVSFKFY